jgi:uncharacterized protein (TIGR03435 family)
MIRGIIVIVLSAVAAFGQSRKEFEVASIRAVGDEPVNQVAAGIRIDGSQVHVTALSLRDYIGVAYQKRINQVVGPDWLGTQRFDISAKIPDGGKREDVNEMMKSLLEERFGMKAHTEMKEFPVYALEVAKTGLKVVETAPADSFSNSRGVNVAAGGSAAGVMINLGEGSFFSLGTSSVQTKKLSMSTFADMLTRFLDRPVVDMTNLKGAYDLDLPLTPEDRIVMLIRSAIGAGVVLPPQALALLDAGSSDSLSDSLSKVGLLLERRRAELEVVVVDQIQKTPTEN